MNVPFSIPSSSLLWRVLERHVGIWIPKSLLRHIFPRINNVIMWRNMMWYDWRNMVWHDIAWHDMIWHESTESSLHSHNTLIFPYNLSPLPSPPPPSPPLTFHPSLTLSFIGLEGLSKGEKMSVRVWGNPSPFAVGLSQINWEIIEMGGTYVCVMKCGVV